MWLEKDMFVVLDARQCAWLRNVLLFDSSILICYFEEYFENYWKYFLIMILEFKEDRIFFGNYFY